MTSTRRAVVGQRCSARSSLEEPEECGAQTAWAFAATVCEVCKM
jgi:hypothetical protein